LSRQGIFAIIGAYLHASPTRNVSRTPLHPLALAFFSNWRSSQNGDDGNDLKI
jgi:hypothetical protein